MAYFRDLCARGRDAFLGVDQVAWFTEARQELDNIRVALAWAIDRADPDTALAIAAGIGWTFWLSGGGEEGVRLLDAALACRGAASPDLRVDALTWECVIRSNAGTGLDRAVELGEEAIALWRDIGDDRNLGIAAIMVAGVHVMRGDRERAVELYAEVERYFTPFPDHLSQAIAASAAGRIAMFRGDLDTAEPLHRAAVEHFEATGIVWVQASVHSDLAILAEMRDDWDAAAAGHREGARSSPEAGARPGRRAAHRPPRQPGRDAR